MPHETDLTSKHFIEGTTPRIGYTLEGADGETITAALGAQTATIYDVKSKTAIPGWTDKDIKGLQGNVVTSGVGVWDLPVDATVKLTTAKSEIHIIAMKFTYATDRVGKHDIKMQIRERAVGS